MRRICNPETVCSIQTGGTKVLSECNVSLVRRPGLEPGGRRFESYHSDQLRVREVVIPSGSYSEDRWFESSTRYH